MSCACAAALKWSQVLSVAQTGIPSASGRIGSLGTMSTPESIKIAEDVFHKMKWIRREIRKKKKPIRPKLMTVEQYGMAHRVLRSQSTSFAWISVAMKRAEGGRGGQCHWCHMIATRLSQRTPMLQKTLRNFTGTSRWLESYYCLQGKEREERG